MNIILWIISPLIFVIGITGVIGCFGWFFNEIERDNWLGKMLIINMNIVLIITLFFGSLAGIWFIHEILCKILF